MVSYKQIVGMLGALFLTMSQNVAGQSWITNPDEAFSEAKIDKKKVLLLFTLKDCSVCKALEANVLDTPKFREFAAAEFILTKIDFSDVENISLDYEKTLLIVEKYNRDGFFPFVVVADYNGIILKKMPPYENESVTQYILNFPR